MPETSDSSALQRTTKRQRGDHGALENMDGSARHISSSPSRDISSFEESGQFDLEGGNGDGYLPANPGEGDSGLIIFNGLSQTRGPELDASVDIQSCLQLPGEGGATTPQLPTWSPQDRAAPPPPVLTFSAPSVSPTNSNSDTIIPQTDSILSSSLEEPSQAPDLSFPWTHIDPLPIIDFTTLLETTGESLEGASTPCQFESLIPPCSPPLESVVGSDQVLGIAPGSLPSYNPDE